MDRLEETHPGVIEDFRAAVTSGSHVRTKQALVTTSRVVVDTVRPSGSPLDPGDPSGKCLALYLAVAVWQYAYVDTYLWELYKFWRAQDADRVLRADDLVHDVIRMSGRHRTAYERRDL